MVRCGKMATGYGQVRHGQVRTGRMGIGSLTDLENPTWLMA